MAAVAERAISVALLGRADEARAQLRVALDELGASVVMEADPAAVDIAALAAGQPQVVLVNLEPGLEDAFDHLQPLFDDPSVRVVFNEADVSSQLSGWDRARWARHLAAKLLGHNSINPPRPEGAEALPDLNILPTPGAPLTPAQMVGDVSIEGFAQEALDSADLVPSEPRLEISETEDAFAGALSHALESGDLVLEDSLEDFSIDLGEIEGAMVETDLKPEVHGAKVPDAAPDVDAAIDFEFDPSVLESALQGHSEIASGGSSDELPVEESIADESLSSDESSVLDEALAGFNLDGNADLSIADLSLEDEAVANLDEDADLVALAAQFDAQSASTDNVISDSAGDFDFLSLEDEPEPAATPAAVEPPAAKNPTPVAAPAASAVRSFDLGGLSLEPMSDEVQPVAQAQAAKASAGAKAEYDFGSLDLSLEPLPEETSDSIWSQRDPASASEASEGATQVASEAPDAGNSEIFRVIVLGASIGGPDALRSFLAELPANFPAMFLLAQHLDSGFFERLAEQLQKVSQLPVRLPTDGARIGHGEILVLGTGERARIDRQGNLRLEEFEVKPAYSPSIDLVLRDVADTFGAQASAIIFSGMAGDAIEGAAYMVSRGGEVWVQEASSCVVSSMVDGIRSRGLSEFTGSPRELARHCIARFGNPV